MWRPHAGLLFVCAVMIGAHLDEPLSSAVQLLGWSGDDVPQIDVVSDRPADRTRTAEAWVQLDPDGRAVPVIHLRADTDVYRDARTGDYQALVRLAGILTHERWHLRHGPDEVGAYAAQLSTMTYLHANGTRLAEIRRAFQQVSRGPVPLR